MRIYVPNATSYVPNATSSAPRLRAWDESFPPDLTRAHYGCLTALPTNLEASHLAPIAALASAMVSTRAQSARAAASPSAASSSSSSSSPPAASSAASASAAAKAPAAEEAARFRYLTPEGARRILEYKYSGSDASLLYNHVISPLAQQLVDHVIPPRLAPNAITISGLALVILSHAVLLWLAPNMEEDAPRWAYAFAGVSLLLYQVLDVADGKQARKTGNSSPLGLLFDHGCDALNVVVSACTFASTIKLGPSFWVRAGPSTFVSVCQLSHLLSLWIQSLLLLLAPAQVFFMATWEEYYTGTLALPIVNGPNEGLAAMYSIYIGTAIVGPEIWTQPNPIFPQLQNNQAFVIMTFGAAMIQCLFSGAFTFVFRDYGGDR